MSLTGDDIDVVEFVRADHRTIKALFTTIGAAEPEDRAATWPDLLHSLSVHEVAEELVVFPALRVIEAGGPAVAARLGEQEAAAAQLKAMEGMDPASAEFGAALGELQAAVLAHAEAEEREILPIIVRSDDVLDRTSLGARYQAAKDRAPTRPHPHAPHTPPGNVLGGPLLSLVDRVRDHLS
jgi:hemerythrin superfamily protein